MGRAGGTVGRVVVWQEGDAEFGYGFWGGVEIGHEAVGREIICISI